MRTTKSSEVDFNVEDSANTLESNADIAPMTFEGIPSLHEDDMQYFERASDTDQTILYLLSHTMAVANAHNESDNHQGDGCCTNSSAPRTDSLCMPAQQAAEAQPALDTALAASKSPYHSESAFSQSASL